MQEINFIFSIVVLVASVVVHEFSHGYVAYMMGDRTAKDYGRLTLNPFKHLDFFGSFLVPLLTYFAGGFIFGWAKPVPYNPYNLKNQKWGPGLVAVSGPLANFSVAILFSLILRYSLFFSFLPASFFQIATLIVYINLILGVFNLIPIPPLDGSKVLFSLLPYRLKEIEIFLERWGFFILVIFIFFLFQFLIPVVYFLFKLLTGINF